MSTETRLQRAARLLADQYRDKRPFSFDFQSAPRTLEEAYDVQEAFQNILAQTHGPVAGFKLAMTSIVMQQHAEVAEPRAGLVLAKNIYHSPATLEGSNYLRLGIECEVATRLGSDLPASGAPYNRDRICVAVDAVMPAFEVIDSRGPEIQDPRARMLASIATNISNAGIVLGPPVTDWREVDLSSSRGSMTINGELAGEGVGSDVMGHPLEPLVWLANMLAERGKGLAAGTVVITGSIVTPKFLNPGDVATVVIEGIGEANLTVT